MRVVAMVGVLMFGLVDGFYEMSMDVFDDGSTAETEQVRSFDEGWPPPPPSNP